VVSRNIFGISMIATLILILVAMLVIYPAQILNWLSPHSYRLINNVVYAPDRDLALDIYQPLSDARDKPVIVFFYGGTWNSGARADYRFVGAALAERGYIVVIPDYRLYPAVRYPQFLDDCARAVAWTLREIPRYGGNRHRVYLLGHSAGAYNAAMLALDQRWLHAQGTSPNALRGWAGLAGPYDFFPSNNLKVQPVFMHPHYPPLAQPIEHVRENRVPAFIAAAKTDNLIDPVRNSEQLAHNLQTEGVTVQLRIYPDVNHVTLLGAFASPLRWLAPVLDDVTAFFHSVDE